VATRRCTVRRDDVYVHAHCSSRNFLTRAIGVLGGAGAAIVGNLTAVRKMLGKQANASKSSNKLRTPLHFAAQEVMTTESNLCPCFPSFLEPLLVHRHVALKLRLIACFALHRGTWMWSKRS
jgi:hypothetical protein